MDSLRVAEIEHGRVKRIILAPSVEWCVEHLGGVWVVDENEDASLGKEYDTGTNAFRASMDDIRKERDQLLKDTDMYGISDYPHPTEDTKQAYLDYRQALRDLPANTENPENPTWPTLALPTEIDPMDILRRTRNELLRKTDHLAFPDYPHLSDQVRADWMAYRQALRDLPANTTDPENPTWPTQPSYE